MENILRDNFDLENIKGLQLGILRKLSRQNELRFNQLWDKQGRSNTFAYHIKILREKNLIEKKDNAYKLSVLGKRHISYLNHHGAPQTFILSIIMKANKYLVTADYQFPMVACAFSQHLMEQTLRLIELKTGLYCQTHLQGFLSLHLFEQGELIANHHYFVIKGIGPLGKISSSKNRWVNKEELLANNNKSYTNLLIEIVEKEKFSLIEADFHQDNNNCSVKNISHPHSEILTQDN